MSGGTGTARHGRLPRRGAWRTLSAFVGSSVAVLLVATTVVAGYLVYDLYRALKDVPPVELQSERLLEGVPDIGAMEGGLAFLLVGSDQRPEDGAFGDPYEDSGILNDVNILLHISQDHSHVEVVSFPRDLLVDVPECPDPEGGEGDVLDELYGVKLNTVLFHGGVGCVAATIEGLTGLTVPLAGLIRFHGVAAMAEAVGGVEVCLVDPIEDPESGLFLEAGTSSITGYTALAFLRTRKAIGDGSDLGRISNQQQFLSSLIRTIQRDGVLGDPVRLYNIAKVVLGQMQLSTRLQDPITLVSVARTLQHVDLSKVVFVQYPTAYTDDFGAVVPTDSAEALNAALRSDAPLQLTTDDSVDNPFGTVPAETSAPVAPPPEASDTPSDAPPDPGTGSPAPTDSTVVALPPEVSGQTGAEVRCSTSNGG
ncbi:LCP family protein [Agromyces sp. LHK192]|uniref:LCP family glycopolymer transferase n=1 Tax=Agromyces sp. LHK192 TaxID=2498704 RepID=UPI0013E32C1D|nr:LCP family protein [Agromyces sp. LHK192]